MIDLLLAPQELLKEVQSLRVVADQDDLVVRLRVYTMQEPDLEALVGADIERTVALTSQALRTCHSIRS